MMRGIRIWICLPIAVSLLSEARKKTVAKRQSDVTCIDTPHMAARKRPVKKLELSETIKQELSELLFGVSG